MAWFQVRLDHMTREVIIRNSLEGIGEGEVALHLAHILCLAGSCEINYNGDSFTIRERDCTIIRATQLVGDIQCTDDFRVEVIYIDPVFIEKATPNNNYGMRGSLSLAQNPVMHLTDEEFERCRDGLAPFPRRPDAEHGADADPGFFRFPRPHRRRHF